MDLFLQIEYEPVRAGDGGWTSVEGFPELDPVIGTLSAGGSFFRSVFPASARCGFDNNVFRCECHLTISYANSKQNLERQQFYPLFDRLTEFVAPLETGVDTVIDMWLLRTWYESEKTNGWSLGVSVYGYAESEVEARKRWNGAVEILHNWLRREIAPG
jgi:hypothetical protein